MRFFWRRHPSWRLGQVVSNAAHAANWGSNDVFYVEDSRIWYGFGQIDAREMQQAEEVNSDAPALVEEEFANPT